MGAAWTIIATARLNIRPGTTAPVRVKLSGLGARLLRRSAGVRPLAIVRARDETGDLREKRVRLILPPLRG
jgi:hypothetical protein